MSKNMDNSPMKDRTTLPYIQQLDCHSSSICGPHVTLSSINIQWTSKTTWK